MRGASRRERLPNWVARTPAKLVGREPMCIKLFIFPLPRALVKQAHSKHTCIPAYAFDRRACASNELHNLLAVPFFAFLPSPGQH